MSGLSCWWMKAQVHWMRKNADLVEKSLLANPNLTLILISHHLSDKRKAQFDCVYELMPTSSRA